MMLYFSKIKDVINNDAVINLEQICLIKCKPADGMLVKYFVCFVNGDEISLDQEQYNQLMVDVDTACSLVKLQKEKGEER
jgi:hypothetical protein